MRVTDPFVNGKGAHRVGVNGTVAELAQFLSVFGASKVSLTFDAESFARDIAPKLAAAGGVPAQQAHEAGLSRDPVRESRKRVARAPKVADAPSTTDLVAAVLAALDARTAAVAAASKPPAKPRAARKPPASKRDAQIAATIASTK